MLDGLTPDLLPRLVLAVGGVGIAFVVLVLVLIYLKRRNSPLFIKGGKSREPRLMVLDAAAVDPKRRLVLIRRDEVEHLLMIGGPTDIVIESGITDRTRAAAASRSLPVEDTAPAHPAALPRPEARIETPVAERTPEPARPVVVAPERAETRSTPPAVRPVAAPVAQPAARAAAPVPTVSERRAPSTDRDMDRAPAARQPETRNVSAMSSILYGEDREPMIGAGPASSAETPAAQRTPQPTRRVDPPVESVPAPAVARPVPTGADAVLDAARDRVPAGQTIPAAASAVTVADAETALAGRMDAMRRVQSAQPGALASPAAQPSAMRVEPPVTASKPKDAEPSDFEKLLEAELDANGVFGRQAADSRPDSRVTNVVASGTVAPPVRVTPPITGATPDVSSEEEVARLLGEIAINRKT